MSDKRCDHIRKAFDLTEEALKKAPKDPVVRALVEAIREMGLIFMKGV